MNIIIIYKDRGDGTIMEQQLFNVELNVEFTVYIVIVLF